MRGLDRAASQADEALIWLATGYLNVNRDRSKVREPFVLPGPWPVDNPNADVTPERRAELQSQLDARSPFAGR
jgi:hypothetical protein